MAGTITATYEKSLAGNYTFNSAAANGVNVAVGTIAFATYTGGGMTWTLDFNNTDFVQISPTSGYLLEYDYSNEAVVVRFPTASVTITGAAENDASIAQEIASDTALASWTAVPFVAFGH